MTMETESSEPQLGTIGSISMGSIITSSISHECTHTDTNCEVSEITRFVEIRQKVPLALF